MDPSPGADDVPAGADAGASDAAGASPPSIDAIEAGSLGAHPERHPDDLPPPDDAHRRVPSGVLWALSLAVVVLGIASWVAFSSESTAPADEVVRLGDPNVSIDPSGLEAPDVAGQPVSATGYPTFDGGTASLTDYAGRPLVVNFWSSTCPPCITEMPAFEQVHQAAGDDIAFVGLAVTDPEDNARALAARTGVSYDLGFDRSGELIRNLGGIGLPTTVFVDAEGTIVEAHTGDLDAAELRERIRSHFGVEVPTGP